MKMIAQKGISLVELMVGLAVGLLIVAGLIGVYIATLSTSGSMLKSTRLDHDLQAIMSIMTNDIRRAGYWNSEAAGAPSTNPFTNTDNINTATAGCILYAYDRGDGAGGAPDGLVEDDERYGFKLVNGAVWMRTSGTTSSDCGNGNWERLSDENVELIDQLTFSQSFKCVNSDTGAATTTASSTGCAAAPTGSTSGQSLVETRVINIELGGRLVASGGSTDTAIVRKSLSGSVRVRNERMTVVP